MKKRKKIKRKKRLMVKEHRKRIKITEVDDLEVLGT